ncbi:hypothetical protein Poli38472_008550 [Pythium oligandrum]|uniref:Uncharacterized protein n=1 Tax=Pythium oligandrum TaxID=41045 RepID=A0A8K1C4C7_PYTOL|nr:hypothetical protein Poli38472_008550 [Pythium oligandrum]|eukprot:TMW55902.1 hypothetical protein Poli38472_008550 [Pythium oligandrum]
MAATMQRNEVDAFLASSMVGLGTPELWQRMSLELDGKTTLEKPHVSKKVLLKAIRMQTDAMRYLVDEFDRLRDKMQDMEREAKNAQKHVERVNAKLITLQGQFEEMTTQVHELEVKQEQQVEQLKRIDEVAAQVRENEKEIEEMQQQIVLCNANHASFVEKVEQDLTALRHDQEVTKQFALQLEDRMNAEEKELFLNSDHIIHNKLTLAMWMEQTDKESRRKDDAIREFTEKMNKQAKNVQEMMLETRRTLDDNTCAVEDVQRLLLLKADRAKVDEVIETKYEEICNQLDKALAAVIGEEDEFKRVSQELQQLVTHLGDSKADKKDLLEVKEQVLYDSRVRQQVENLRAFIDLKMNRDDVFSALKNKADKDEMVALLKGLSDSMNASIQQAQRTFTEAESAFLTGKNVLPAPQKRGGMLPSLDKERCLSCNSVIRDSPAPNGGALTNKSPHPMAPVYGGGFQVASVAPSPLGNVRSSNNNDSVPGFGARNGRNGNNTSSTGALLSESASEGYVLAQPSGKIHLLTCTFVDFSWVLTGTCTKPTQKCLLYKLKTVYPRKAVQLSRFHIL